MLPSTTITGSVRKIFVGLCTLHWKSFYKVSWDWFSLVGSLGSDKSLCAQNSRLVGLERAYVGKQKSLCPGWTAKACTLLGWATNSLFKKVVGGSSALLLLLIGSRPLVFFPALLLLLIGSTATGHPMYLCLSFSHKYSQAWVGTWP